MRLLEEEHLQFLAIAAALNRDMALQAIASTTLSNEKMAEALWLLALYNKGELRTLAVSALISCPEDLRLDIFFREANSGEESKVEVACEMAKEMSSSREVRAMIFELLARPEGREAAIGVLNHWMTLKGKVDVILAQLKACTPINFAALVEVVTPHRSLSQVQEALFAIANDREADAKHAVLAQRVLNM